MTVSKSDKKKWQDIIWQLKKLLKCDLLIDEKASQSENSTFSFQIYWSAFIFRDIAYNYCMVIWTLIKIALIMINCRQNVMRLFWLI